MNRNRQSSEITWHGTVEEPQFHGRNNEEIACLRGAGGRRRLAGSPWGRSECRAGMPLVAVALALVDPAPALSVLPGRLLSQEIAPLPAAGLQPRSG
jgi:hypothetical protein